MRGMIRFEAFRVTRFPALSSADSSGLSTRLACQHFQAFLDPRDIAVHPRKLADDLLPALLQGTYLSFLLSQICHGHSPGL
jgi:hypothetical protein